jgi:hypothetical protein
MMTFIDAPDRALFAREQRAADHLHVALTGHFHNA